MKKLIALALGVVIAVGAAAQEKERTSGMTVTIGGTDFAATLDGNDAAKNIAALLPLSLSMSEWAGNSEYYARLSQKTDTGNAVSPRSFAAGDIALYNGLSLVIFYAATTQTSGYVKIGHIDGANLKESLDRAKGSVTFGKQENRRSVQRRDGEERALPARFGGAEQAKRGAVRRGQVVRGSGAVAQGVSGKLPLLAQAEFRSTADCRSSPGRIFF